MKKLLLTALLLLVIGVVAACGSDDNNQENASNTLPFNEADLNLSLYDSSGNLVSISPDGKTIYAYFTGVG